MRSNIYNKEILQADVTVVKSREYTTVVWTTTVTSVPL